MTETRYSDKTFKLLRGLRRPTPELDLSLAEESQPASPVTAPKRHKLVPVYGLPVLCHCPKYGEFWRPKVIGHELVKLEDDTDDVRLEDGSAKATPMTDDDVSVYKKNDTYRSEMENGVAKPTPMTDEDVRVYKKKDTCTSKLLEDVSKATPVTNEDVKSNKRNDAHRSSLVSENAMSLAAKNDTLRSSLVSEDTGKLTAEKLSSSLRKYDDKAYKILRGLRKFDDDLIASLPSLCADHLSTRPAPRVRVIPTYGQPVLVHCARYGTFRQWKIVDHEIVRPGKQFEEEVPEDVDDFVEVDECTFPENDDAYRRYKKFDTYDLPDTEDNSETDTEKADAASSASQASPLSEVPVSHPLADEDDEDMGGLFGIYARDH